MDRFNTFKLFIQEHRNKIIVSCIFVLILFIGTIFFLNIDRKTKTKTESIIFENSNLKESEDLSNSKYIYVDIKGEVELPGVYSLEDGKRVVDAINIAGGLKASADTSLLNLSMKLVDQMVILVYSKDELQDINTLKEKQLETEKICKTEIINEACICNNENTIVTPALKEEKNQNEKNNNSNNKININTASKEILLTIPKIGNVKAEAIISYRNNNGKFKTIEEIKNVKGIGESLFESIKDYITV